MIRDHVFRPRTGSTPAKDFPSGRCMYLGTCNRTEQEHISAEEYRKRRERG